MNTLKLTELEKQQKVEKLNKNELNHIIGSGSTCCCDVGDTKAFRKGKRAQNPELI